MKAGDPPPVRGTCFGYRVRSHLELNYLRGGDQGAPLDIVVGSGTKGPPGDLLLEWEPPHHPSHVRLHADDPGFRIWVEGGGWFGVEPRVPRITVPATADGLRREERVWGLPALLCLLARGDVPLHASAVELGGRALLLAAPSRFGKTTLVAGFALRGYRVLSEDLSCIRPGPTPSVIPGPAMLRVRRDVAEALRIRGTEELGRDPDRLHLAIRTDRGTCAPVPLAGIVLLNEGDVDPRVEPVAGAEVVRNLWTVSFNLPTDEDRTRSFQAVAELAGSTRTWSLTRRLELRELEATIDSLLEAVEAAG